LKELLGPVEDLAQTELQDPAVVPVLEELLVLQAQAEQLALQAQADLLE
jgi:hypothetical protein